MKAVVVGTGFGAIATGLRLCKQGFQVEMFESAPDSGGRGRTFSIEGHLFDAGPTVITAPWLFDELFALFGEDRSKQVEFLPCDPWYRVLFADGTNLDLVPTVERQEEQLRRFSIADAKNYRSFLEHSEKFYKVGYEKLGVADFSKFSEMLKSIPKLVALGGFKTLWQHTAKYFSDRRIRQAFSIHPLLVGGNPLTTTAIYALIHAMERKGGIWFASGGTRKLVSNLIALATRNGIKIHYNSKVTELVSNNDNKLTGIKFKQNGLGKGSNSKINSTSQIVDCDLVVWGGDPQEAYKILGPKRLSLTEKIRLKSVKQSMGLYVLYFKTKRKYPEVVHHSIILSKRWEELLTQIFRGKSLPHDPSLYLHRPAATDTKLKDEDGDLFYVLAPVPHLGNFNDWESEEAKFKKTVLNILEDRVLPDLNQELIFSESIDPRYFKNVLHSYYGAGFSIAPTLSQSAWFRFHNRSDKVSNLYFCGAGVHPGGGLPGVVTSAKLVGRLISEDFPQINPYSEFLSSEKTAKVVGA